jgi:hypothetical protein
MNERRRWGRRKLVGIGILAALLGTLGSGALVWQASQAAFSGSTHNTTNNFATNTVTLSDDDTGSAMFNATGLTTNSTGSKCIKVTYTGDVAAPIKLYAANLTGNLGAQLALTVEIGSAAGAGTFADCTGFTPSSTLYSPGTLNAFSGAYTNYANGLATGWTPSTNGDYRVFKFTYTVANNNAANGQNCQVDFSWEAVG